MFELGNNELIYAAEDSFRSSPVVRKWNLTAYRRLSSPSNDSGFLFYYPIRKGVV